MINNYGINLGWHTVYTTYNYGQMRELYRMLKREEFAYWNIYQVNPDLAGDKGWLLDEEGTIRMAQTDGLLAQFLLEEERMQKKRRRAN